MPEGYIPVVGGQVWYKLVNPNAGIPLLILHGGPGSSHYYLEPLEQLASERTVIFYDQLGCGNSERPDDTSLWQRERFVQELHQIREALHLEQIHLFGHSWGAMLAIDYALSKPEGIKSLILASPPLSIPRWLQDTERYRKSLPLDVQKTLKAHESNNTTDSDEYQDASMEFYRRYLCRLDPWPEPLERTLANEGTAVYETMWGPSEFYMTGNLLDYDRSSQLKEIAIPTLFTCGRYDEATPEASAWYQTLLPHSELAIFEQSAHMAHLEETDLYVQTVRNFLHKAQEKEMQAELTGIKQAIHQVLSEQLRIGTGIDFHSLYEGYPLTLAGVSIPFDKGFHVKRSDGDPVSHALVDALLAALGEGDIADWFNDQDGTTNARSIDYLKEVREKLLIPRNIAILNVQIIVMAEQPKLKPFFSQMQEQVACQLGIDSSRVSIQGKTFEGKGIIGQQQGIETQVIVALLKED